MLRQFLCLLALSAPSVWAQASASLSGLILDPSAAAVAGATVRLSNALTGYASESISQADGKFQFVNVPFQTYVVKVEKPGFEATQQPVVLRTNIPVTLEIRLPLAGQGTTIDVTASELRATVDPEATGTRTELNASSFARLPQQASGRGIESVLISFPGFAANANGAIHPRGAHNQMSYIIDGMPITDQLTGAFANAVDPSIVQNIELFTGDIPAEYGSKISGVANITTRSGMGVGRKFFGSTQVYGDTFDTLSQVTQVGGGTDKFGYLASVNTFKSNRFLDSVSLDNLHNGGNSERGFVRLDWQPGARDQLRFNVMSGRSSFELANLRSQHANRQQQRQVLRDLSVSTGWLRTIDARSTLDLTVSYRTAIAQLFGSPGDTPVTAEQARHLSTLNFSGRYNRIWGRHTIRAGADTQRFPVSENFEFGITAPGFNDPEREDFVPTLEQYDLSRGGRLFRFSKKRSGQMDSGFLQDRIKMGNLLVSLGLRYDNYRFIVRGNQLQPRIGLSYHIKPTGTVLRASYNRTYQTPPNENLLLASSEEAGLLVPPGIREALGNAYVPIRPERQNVIEAGFQQGIGSLVSINGVYYHKNSADMQDNDNFLNTGIIFPTSLLRSRVNGAEGRVSVLPLKGLSGSVSFTHYRAIVTPPFTGGLFLGSAAVDALSAGPFIIDHDQTLGVHGLLNYSFKNQFWTTLSIRYDSGLVSNPSDPVDVARDPDYADLLPYVNLGADPTRVRPRTITDVSFGHDHYRNDRRIWDIAVSLINLTDQVALYNFQSIFVGTRVVQPRTAGVKLRFYW